jgi:hypothetical protein
VNRPDLLLRPLPLRHALPVERIEVVQHARSVHHEVVLPVVDEHPCPAQDADDFARVAAHDIALEGVVDCVRARHVVHILRNAQLAATAVEQGNKSVVVLAILSEIESAHSAPELVPCIVVVRDKVEKWSSLI